MSALAAIAIFTIAFVLIATEKVHRVAVALFAAGMMALLGLVPGKDVFFSEHAGIDWNVIFLLLGMMIIVGVIKQTGVFEFLAIWAAKRSGGRPYKLLVLLMVITAVASPFLDNVTTIMLVAPVTVLVCRRLGIPAAPYLIAEALASNIGGAATLIGDPPNIIIGSRAGLTFNDFVVHMAPIVVVLFALFILLAWVMFRKRFEFHPERVAEVMAMDERASITDRRLLARCLAVLALVVAGFALHAVIHVEPAIIALLGAGLMVLVARVDTSVYLQEVEWSTLVFFMGLFVMVGGLVETGVIHGIGTWATGQVGDDYFLAATGLLFGSAVLGAFFDNIPYVATMAPIVEDIVATTPDPATGQSLWWAFALGADFGGNGTAVAASANVVVLGIAARAGEPISFWQFTRYGIVTTVMTTVIAWAYVWLRYFS
ncbi:ArsB/NhaD family transporter [Dactylosporangium aurantiacum]|uniref:ArsB/NhaD family transporter n=1 Tax=Dactylosporangium aurantiacum TaxID=35754 RepID=A0A9Q9IDN2_9ACTN|nr:ArsB/NhaD family transporter [Dactylosporangium aurantiacum]MDG6106985.1 ArsB/NhaD family transporter [Dactylosporangium aurantiacum]UWZ50655.1 ArsB/NhaD family transporter [Dactylosporangium aurantiacum]